MINFGSVVCSLGQKGLHVLSLDVVVGLDTYIDFLVGDVSGGLNALIITAGLPGVVDGEANLCVGKET